MRLVVLDTNIIVSAGVSPLGTPAKLTFDWFITGRARAITSPAILAEYREVVRRPKFKRYGFPPLWLEFLIEESMELPEPEPWDRPGPDPTNLPFLALTHASGAWLVTGNLKHFPAEMRKGVTVLSPADYLAHLLNS